MSLSLAFVYLFIEVYFEALELEYGKIKKVSSKYHCYVCVCVFDLYFCFNYDSLFSQRSRVYVFAVS